MANVIVVGVDASETALKAAHEAALLAAALGAQLDIVSAFDRNEVEVVEIGTERWVIGSAEDALQTATNVASHLRSIVSDISVSAGDGKPADVIIERAREVEARMIVVGNRRMQGIGRVLGSVANTIAHHAPCDVHIVKTV